MSDVKFLLGAELQLFKTDLVGMIDSDSGCLVVRQPNAGFDAPGMTIQEFVADVKVIFEKIGIDIPDIKLPDVIDTVTKEVSIYLKEIFMIIQTKDPKSVEFAIWVSMDTSDALQKQFPIAIKQGYLKVWNTNRDIILDEMQISGITKLIGSGSGTKALPDKKDADKEQDQK